MCSLNIVFDKVCTDKSFQNEVQFYQHHILNVNIYMYIEIYENKKKNNRTKHNSIFKSVFNIMLKIFHTSMIIKYFDEETIFKQEAQGHTAHPSRSPSSTSKEQVRKLESRLAREWFRTYFTYFVRVPLKLVKWPLVKVNTHFDNNKQVPCVTF